ncbi:MAG: IS66 family insertion sequence element accessory protein TnpB [Oliverpabstia sp.]
MLGDISGIQKIFCVTGATDMRRSIDGLMAIIRDTYKMDPYAHALYLFCGKRRNTIKALYFDRDGFCLLYKRIDGPGRFQWPKNAAEVRPLTRQEFRWLMEGLSVDQPKAIQPSSKRDRSF